MTFNYTSLPGNRDCILLAWLPDSKYISDIFRHVPLSMFMSYSSAGQHFAQSQGVFSDRPRGDNFIHTDFLRHLDHFVSFRCVPRA